VFTASPEVMTKAGVRDEESLRSTGMFPVAGRSGSVSDLLHVPGSQTSGDVTG
jgi:hypothetical protein